MLKKSKYRLGIFLAVLLGIILLSVPQALSQKPIVLNLLLTAPDAQPWKQGKIGIKLMVDFDDYFPSHVHLA
ncbi:hypothetical protein [Scytonema hofmannii]|uniref:hypothetical protein n=1 Tax=Scytonema hofmannii TaxID=34078 RepID=UPI001314D5AD|nr:hypothetical protein [Scytonema hofmannii]